jgi:hypothetical protein
MAIGGFFKIQKHKDFSYKPRYYDADREELNKRIKRAEQQVNSEKEGVHVSQIKGKMHRHLIDQKRSSRSHSFIRTLIILVSIGLLMLIFYFLIQFTGFFYTNV